MTSIESPHTVRRRRWRTVVPIVCLVAVGIAVWASRSTVLDALGALRRADASWVALAASCQGVVYASLGLLLQRLFSPEIRLRAVPAVAMGLVVFGLGGVLPASPAEGVTLTTLELSRRGVRAGRGAGVLMLAEWVRFLALAVVFALDLVVAALNGRHLRLSFPTIVALAICILGLVVVAAAAIRSRWMARLVSGVVDRAARRRFDAAPGVDSDAARSTVMSILGSPRHQLVIGWWAVVGWTADAACLSLCVRALGGQLGLDGVLVAYVVGAAVALAPLLPGGLGAVEVVVPAVMHHFGVPLHVAVAATLAWRGLSLIAPALAGAAALAGLRRFPAHSGAG